jgi:hypothetical protein
MKQMVFSKWFQSIVNLVPLLWNRGEAETSWWKGIAGKNCSLLGNWKQRAEGARDKIYSSKACLQ